MEKTTRKGRPLSIKRTLTPTSESAPTQEQAATPVITPSLPSATGGIALASSNTDNDPFRKSVTEAGYIILEENEYGVIARPDKGKPSFIPRTSHGFDPNEKECRNTIILAEHIDTAMKVHAAKTRMNITQYLTQLLVSDLKKQGCL